MKRLTILFTLLMFNSSLFGQWIQTSGPEGSYVHELERVNNEIWAATQSGLFISENEGLTWQKADFLPPEYSVRNIIVDGDEILLSTGLYDFNFPQFFPFKFNLLRSTDAGLTWTSKRMPVETFGNYYFYYDEIMVLHKSDNYLFVSYRGRDIYRSADLGDTWEEISSPPSIGASAFSGDKILATNSVYCYLSIDAGDTWETLDAEGSSGGLLFEDDLIMIETVNDFIYISNDLGASSISVPSTGYVFNETKFRRGNSGKIYLMGDRSFISEDDGLTWERLNDFSFPAARGIDVIERNDGSLLVDNDDWFFSVDNGLTWNSASMTGLPPAEYDNKPRTFLSIGDNIYTIAGENEVHLSTDYGENWASISEGLDGYQGNHLFYANDQIYLGSISSGVWRRSTFFQSQGGLVFYDENNNGTKDIHESPLANVLVHSTPIDHFTRSRNDGVYIFYTETFNDTIRAIPPSPYATVQPDYYLSSQPTTTLDFAVSYIPNKDDLSINLTSYEPFRPGFDNQVDIMIKNLGTTTLSPIVKLPIPEELTFLEADISPTQVVDTLIWELPELPQFGSVKITVDFNVNLDNELGNWLNMEAEVFPIAEDQDPSNNRDNLTAQFVGSYDPNDKQVKPLGNYTPEQLANDEPLVYKVRFQNTGTYLAENVRIIDTLSEKLDISTFELVSASHPVEWNLRGPNVLEFVFQNIMLPDSASNLEASNGYVEFSIVPQKNLTLGDEIPNFADIYFDFNEPIRTNTSIATFDLSTGLKSLKLVEKTLYLSPNPAGDHCFISVEDGQTGNGLLSFYDGQGKLVLERKIEIGNSPKMIDLEKLTAGYYSVKFILGKEVYGGKLIKH